MTYIPRLISVGLAAAALGIASPVLANHPAVSSNFGTPVHGDGFDRRVDIDPQTKWAHVVRNEVVKFVVTRADGTKSSFAWQFDTFGERFIALDALAPAGATAGHAVTVHVGRERGGR